MYSNYLQLKGCDRYAPTPNELRRIFFSDEVSNNERKAEAIATQIERIHKQLKERVYANLLTL
jgi:hypothetical protein